MKIRGSDDDDIANTNHECEKYNYDWKGWTDANTDGDQDSGLEPGNVKFNEFMTTPFKKIRMCTDDGSTKNSKVTVLRAACARTPAARRPQGCT